MRKISKIIVHHTADDSAEDQFEKVNLYHLSRGFPVSVLGFFVGYHFFIEKSGELKVARLTEEIGAHDKDENAESVGVALAGNFDLELPSNAQILTLAKLLAFLTKEHGLAAGDVEPHRLRDTTSCYGKNLSDDWASSVLIAYLAVKNQPLQAWIH